MVRKRVIEAEGRPNIVVPTIRDNDFFYHFIDNWGTEFSGCHLIVIEDRQKKQLKLNDKAKQYGFTYEQYDWKDIDSDLKDKAWIISRETDCVRNYGYLMAYRNKPLFIVTLDDDLKPASPGHIQQFYNTLYTPVKQDPRYLSTMNSILPRGKLVKTSEVVIVHGGWYAVPDLDAETQIKHKGTYVSGPCSFYEGIIPHGCFYSMCGMNLAWKPEITHLMYFPLMGKKGGYPIDRCGDIWAGYYSKYQLDKIGNQNLVVHTGGPYVVHNRASNPWTNLIKEENADLMGEQFIEQILKGHEGAVSWSDYWKKLKEAYSIWQELLHEIDFCGC